MNDDEPIEIWECKSLRILDDGRIICKSPCVIENWGNPSDHAPHTCPWDNNPAIFNLIFPIETSDFDEYVRWLDEQDLKKMSATEALDWAQSQRLSIPDAETDRKE